MPMSISLTCWVRGKITIQFRSVRDKPPCVGNNQYLLWNCFLHKCNHFRGEDVVAMIFLVGPCGLGIRETLTIGGNKVCRPVCKSISHFQSSNKKGKAAHLRIWSRGMSSRHPNIFHSISSRVLAWPAMRNWNFAAPQYCSIKFSLQWYLG